MVTTNDFDTSFAKTVSQIMATVLSSYSASPDTLMGRIDIEKIIYGKRHITRPISDPEQSVHVDVEFNPPTDRDEKRVQDLDLANVSKRIFISRVDWEGDPLNAQNHIRDLLNIFKDGVEKLMIEGCSEKVLMYGLSDFPDAVAGTINRPEMAGWSDVTADWSSIANMQTDIITKLEELITSKFYGPYVLLAPSIVRPMIAKQLVNTATPVEQWIETAIGVPVIFSPFVHEAASALDFNCYLVDLSKIHFGMSDIKIDSFYHQKDHGFYVDIEAYVTFLSDPLQALNEAGTATEWQKGIANLDACSWGT